MTFHVPEYYRQRDGQYATTADDGNNGTFVLDKPAPSKGKIHCVASDGGGWERVTVSVGKGRQPSWELMEHIKAQFWDEEDAVYMVHLPKSLKSNKHPHKLTLWRPACEQMPLPDASLLTGRPGDVLHSFTCQMLRQGPTGKSFLVKFDDGTEVWLPLSQVKVGDVFDEDMVEVQIPAWLCQDKGLLAA